MPEYTDKEEVEDYEKEAEFDEMLRNLQTAYLEEKENRSVPLDTQTEQ